VIYRVNNDSYDVWLQTLVAAGVKTNNKFLHDVPGLLALFASSIAGYVRFDMNTSLDTADQSCVVANISLWRCVG